MRTESAIDRADVCVLVLDAVEGLTVEDKRIATAIDEEGKGCIIVFNKWDLIHGFRVEHCLQQLKMEANFLSTCPILFISAKTGKRVDQIFPTVDAVYAAMHQRISTGTLNRVIEELMRRVHPPMIQGKRLRIYYTTQVEVDPPSLVAFVNYPNLMTESYRKYLLNGLRKHTPFLGSPVRFSLRGKKASIRS